MSQCRTTFNITASIVVIVQTVARKLLHIRSKTQLVHAVGDRKGFEVHRRYIARRRVGIGLHVRHTHAL